MKIHFWCPELFIETGGIQRYSQCLLRSLKSLFPSSQLDVFLKHDLAKMLPELPTQELRVTDGSIRFHTAGHCPQRVRTAYFGSQILSAGLWQKPDLIVTSHLNFIPVAHYLKQFCNIPYWTSAHGIEAWNITAPRIKSALQNADQILSVSHYTRDRLLSEQSINPNTVRILPNTFDANCFNIGPKPRYLLKRYALHPDQPVIFTLGRLSQAEAYKGYDSILKALPTIQKSIPNVHYILAGKGTDQQRVEKLIKQLSLEDCVTLTGFIPETELTDHYNLCDVFAMPSKGEGFGIVYLEALACGKPTLGGNQDGTTDALCNGALGALVNPDDTTEIANILVAILSGTYENRLIYQPEQLRQQVIKTFGQQQFKKTLQTYLKTSFAIP